MNFAENLTMQRRSRGWSQEELGTHLNVTRQTVSKWELGQTTPELEKLIELARLFETSIDELVGLDKKKTALDESIPHGTAANVRDAGLSAGVYYEYKSKLSVFGIPVVHIRLGHGLCCAKGLIAIGNCAVGLLAVGGFSLGFLAVGGICAGILLAIGGLSLGAIAIGGLAVGIIAAGAVAIGKLMAFGGVALADYLSIGGVATAECLAIGGVAEGHVAIGNTAEGQIHFLLKNEPNLDWIWSIVKAEFPHMPGWVKHIIHSLLSQ